MTRRALPIHPWLIALFPVLLLYSRNLHAVEFSETMAPALISVLTTSAVWFSLRCARLDRLQAALVASSTALLFFSFGPFVRLLAHLVVGSGQSQREWLVLAGELSALAGLIGLLLLKPGIARASTVFANATAGALVLLPMVGIVRQVWADRALSAPLVNERSVPRLVPGSGRLPDVYFLILDAYGRADTLQEVMGFENSAFVTRLEQKGFFVASQSRANYCQTALSLSATLNLGYLDDLAGFPTDNRLPLRRLIADSSVVRAFRTLGYRVVTFDSGFDATEVVEADLSLGPQGDFRTFLTTLIDQTPLWLLLGRRAEHRPERMHRERILKAFHELPVAGHPSHAPTFTLAHCLAPHPPFLFDSDGRDVSEREGSYSLNDCGGWRDLHGGPSDYAERYREQVSFINARVEDAVDRILASSTVEPIIIIQGDHGPGSHFDAGSPEPNDLRERMTVLNAIYLPRAYRGSIDPAITPVNTFRLVFDRCFGARLGLLDDRSYYSTFEKPYVFTDVTGKIDAPQAGIAASR